MMLEQIGTFVSGFASGLASTLPTAIALGLGFTLLSFLFTPCNPGHRWWRNPELGTDLTYFFVMPLVGRYASLFFLFVALGALLGFGVSAPDELIGVGRGPLKELSFWQQVVVYVVLQELMLYWSHRAFHTARLWRYHAIHHSPEHLDWVSGRRFHPIDFALHSALPDFVCIALGIAPEVFLLMAPFNVWHSALVHANLNWTFGPFRHVLASPVFHRWHHTDPARGGQKNFAPTFPFVDLIFGTFYMPRGVLPDRYGIDDTNFPKHIGLQLLYPFRTPAARSESPAAAKPSEVANCAPELR
jgi:sterol desaturase/sphingolipid hydroxylase (fatty acid hydroxylase superfamily)